jgi:hypothetical protein
MSPRLRWLVVMAYAAAMAWVEAAVVAYLRIMIDRIDPYQPDPLPLVGGIGGAELVREGATLLMHLAVGALAGQTRRSRFGFAAAAFGAWDLLYYVFLRLITGWPHSLLDWDILFLIPLPWWGPVLSPAAIAALMLAGGTLLGLGDRPAQPLPVGKRSWAAGAAGATLALYCFTAAAWGAIGSGPEGIRQALPTEFPWLTFSIALALLSIPALRVIHAWALRERARRGLGGHPTPGESEAGRTMKNPSLPLSTPTPARASGASAPAHASGASAPARASGATGPQR